MVPIRFFGTAADGDLDKNEYIVTNQWVYPQEQGGKRLDLVLLVNGFPLVIGEFKTPVRDSITWLDGAGDIAKYEKSIPQMFVCSAINFASEGKCYRYGSVNMLPRCGDPGMRATRRARAHLPTSREAWRPC